MSYIIRVTYPHFKALTASAMRFIEGRKDRAEHFYWQIDPLVWREMLEKLRGTLLEIELTEGRIHRYEWLGLPVEVDTVGNTQRLITLMGEVEGLEIDIAVLRTEKVPWLSFRINMEA